MAYKRPTKEKRKEPPAIWKQWRHLEEIRCDLDPGWLEDHLQDLYGEGNFALDQLYDTIQRIRENKSLDDLKPEIAKARKAELTGQARTALLGFLKRHIEDSASKANAASNEILRMSAPDSSGDPIKAMLAELKAQEIRSIIRATDPKHRKDLIASRGLDFIKACVGSPDPLLSDATLTELRRHHAFTVDPSLEQYERDMGIIRDHIRERAAQINSASIKLLVEAGLEDPMTPRQFFEIFTPRNDHEQALADKRIQAFERAQEQTQRKAEFEKTHPGLNLQAGLRRVRSTSDARAAENK